MWWRFKEYVVAVAPVIALTLVLGTASLVVAAGVILAFRHWQELSAPRALLQATAATGGGNGPAATGCYLYAVWVFWSQFTLS
jgi:hypothetical protein